MNDRRPPLRIAALFVLSGTLVAYELAVMRAFAVGSWSNFGNMVISIALLGYGLAGTALTFLEKRVERNHDGWLAWSAALLGPSMAVAHALAQKLPFNPVMITTDPSQFLWIAAYYALYAVPFFIGAVFIGVAFVAFRARIHELYFWNMLGSGLGGFLVLGLMYILPPDRLIGPLVALASLAGFLALVTFRTEDGRPLLPVWKSGLAGLALCASLALLATQGSIRVSEFKPISYARDFPDVQRVHHSFGPTGEFDAYRSSFFHVAPGLSDNASSNIANLPVDAFLGLYVDGDGPMGIMRRLKRNESAYLDYLPMAAPYLLLREPRVLLLRMGGGIGAYEALHHGASAVTIVEPDKALLRMLRDDDYFKDYTGDLLADPRIEVRNTEPRAFAAEGRAKASYDLVEISLVDSVGLSQTGGYSISENFLYTVEGIASYLSDLRGDGMLSITVWNRLTPPRNVPKLLTTVVEALRKRGAAEPERQVFVFDQLLSTASVLVKDKPFTQAEIDTLREFCERMSFTPCYYPGMAPPQKDRAAVLAAYRLDSRDARRAEASPPAAAGEVGAGGANPDELYYHVLDSVFLGKAEELYTGYLFSIRPATDDKPYYSAYVKPAMVPDVVANIKDLSEEWGYVLLVATFALSLLFGLLIILMPMIGKRRELFSGRGGTARVIAYFAVLGIGYMLVEIFLIQRLTFFLVDQIFSNSVVICSMLVLSGVGSLASGSSRSSADPRKSRRTWQAIAVAGICASCLFYVFALPALVSSLLGLPLAAKICISVLVIAPAAFCLGIPFPTGLTALSESRPGLIPWAWGVNGALSVTGTVLARLVSVSAGFTTVLALVMALYLVSLIAYSGTEAGSVKPS